MPWCHIDPKKLEFIKIFGYEVLDENDRFILGRYSSENHGDMMIPIKKDKPFLYFDEIQDALQLGVIGVIQGPVD